MISPSKLAVLHNSFSKSLAHFVLFRFMFAGFQRALS